ncbi:MAG: FIST N-terminal domain-containing protein [Candidatus Omnitrophota bacterium]|jgi:hypothetical protein
MAIQASIGLSAEKDPVSAAKEAVLQARRNLRAEKIDLAITFGSVDLFSAGLVKTLGVYLADTPIIGCSSTAIISSQGIYKRGLAVMLLSFPEGVYFNTACLRELGAKMPQAAGEELGEKLLYGFSGIRRDLGIMFSDGLMRENAKLIYGLQERLGSSFPFVGASASDNLRFSKSYLYFNHDIFSNAACGVLLGGKLNFGLGTKHGWQPLGKPRRVTRSKDNIVYEIGGVSAVNFYEEYFGYSLSKLRRELKLISVLYPIGIYLPGEEEYLLRNILSIENDGSLVFQGDVPEESEIRLMIGTKESALEAARQALEEAKKSLSGSQVNLVLILDSISRYLLLGRDADKELDVIREGLEQDTPLIGLYTYGEQAPLTAINYRGKAYFHNQTISILAIGS